MAAVSVVLPWSTCPMVPMLRCGLSRTYACLVMTGLLLVPPVALADPRAFTNKGAASAAPYAKDFRITTADRILVSLFAATVD